ncbi:MAG TPA: hypothetical protein VM820_18065 [Vicinamibacterales bacterium]|nr:hypothetical protein [Vicinamibacterales bacterium]
MVQPRALLGTAALFVGCNAALGISDDPVITPGEAAGTSGAAGSSTAGSTTTDDGGETGKGGTTGDGGMTGDAGMTGGGVCVPNTQSCQQGGVVICDDEGAWSEPTPCPFVCVGSECSGECLPDSKRCSMGRAQTCGQDGLWDTGTDCPVLCDQGQCATSCTENSKSCDELIPQLCVDGAWQNGTPCDFVCDQGECVGECTPNDKKCEGADRQTCSAAGEWGTDFTCPFICSGTSCGGECVPEDVECVDDNSIHTCDANGLWLDADSCGDMACYMDACIGECKPQERQCVSVNTVQECQNDGSWDDVGGCGSQICRDGNCEDNLPFSVGFSDITSTYSVASGSIYLMRVHSAVHAQLLYFGFGRGAKASTNARLTLYGDGNADGKPDTRVAFSSSNLNFSAAGNAEVGPTPAATELAANTDYWIGVEVDQSPSPLYVRTQAGAPTVYQYGNNFASGPPVSLVSDDLIDLTDLELNLYLVVQEIPQ